MIKYGLQSRLTDTVFCNAQLNSKRLQETGVSLIDKKVTRKNKKCININISNLFRSRCPKTSASERPSPYGNCDKIQDQPL